jgi:hypothetical protein
MAPPPLLLTTPSDVATALDDHVLRPPPWPGPTGGATEEVRNAMARFSDPTDHAPRRADVTAAIATVDLALAEAHAADATARWLHRGVADAVELARAVPTEALAACLGLARPASGVLADVDAMARVIGRGEAATADADEAVTRLRADVAHLGPDPVPWLSLLYQDLDATAALVTTTLLARAARRPAVAAVPRTRRTAADATIVNGRAVPAGTDVTLELGAAGLPFGAGPHRCPGEALAGAIVIGIIRAIDATARDVAVDHASIDGDGRPTTLPLRRREAC